MEVLRQQAELTPEMLADRTDLSVPAIREIESGDYDPTWGSMRKVAQGLGVSMETLAELADDYEEPDPPSA